MGSSVKGFMAVYVEPVPGRVKLLGPVAVSASMSLGVQPNAVNSQASMFLHIEVLGNTTSGTVTVTGKKADGTTVVTDTTTTLPAAGLTSPKQEYALVPPYCTVDASGVTTTGLTNGTITVYGVYAATKLIPANFNPVEKFDTHLSNDHRNIMYAAVRSQQLGKHVSFDKFDSDLYPDTSLYWPYCIFGIPSTTLIASAGSTPDVCLAATLVSGSPLSLTTQPRFPGQLLQFVVTGAGAAGSITLTGLGPLGQVANETILATGNGTFYSQNVYTQINASGVVVAGLTGGSVAIGGYFATRWVFIMPNDPVSTLACALFSGTDSSVYPFVFLLSGDFTHEVEKQINLASKVMAQDQIALGDRSTNPMTVSRLPVFAQPTDYVMAGWSALVYIDPETGTPGTTQFNDLLSCKISADTGMKETFVAKNQQVYDRAYREAPLVKFESEVDFVNMIEYEHFRKFTKRLLVFKFTEANRYYGTSSGAIVQKYWQWTLPSKYQVGDKDRSKEKVMAKLKGVAEYSELLGYAARLEIVNQQPPSYATI